MADGDKITVWLTEIFSIGLLALTCLPLARYGNLPETIPTHFNFMGEADGWGPPSALWRLSVIAALFYIIFTVISAFPGVTANLDGKRRKDDSRFQELTVSLARYIKLIFMALFAYMANVSAGFIGRRALSPWIMWGLIAILAAVIIWFAVRTTKPEK